MAGYIGTKASVVTPGAERKKVFSITTTTTSLTGLVYTPGFVHVFHNGVRLVDGTDYTATNGTSITLTTAAQNGDEVVVISYATFQTSDTVSASAGGTFNNDVAINGDLTVDTNTLFVDATNNRVGIGTSSPSTILHVNAGAAADTNVRIQAGASGNHAKHTYSDLNNTVQWTSGYQSSTGNFGISVGDSFNATGITITSSGHLLVGKTSTSNDVNTQGAFIAPNGKCVLTAPSGDQCIVLAKTGVSGSQTSAEFYYNGAVVGSISTTSAGTTYNTTSDRRLKENIEAIADGTEKLMAMRPVTHTWKNAPEAPAVHGFIAQEMIDIVPEAVTGDPTGEEMMSMDYGRITPVIVAALQDALLEIHALKARVAELEGK